MRFSINKKTIIITVMSLLVFASAATAYIQLLSNNIYNETDSYLNNIAIQTANAIDSRIQSNLTQLKTISLLVEESKMSNNEILNYLESLTLRVNNKRFGIIDENGQARTSDGQSFDAKNREYYQETLLGKDVISDVLMDIVDGQSINVFSVPLYDNNHQIKGAVFSTFSSDKFSNILENASYEGMGYSFIFDEIGNIIVFSKNTDDQDKISQLQLINQQQDFSIDSIDIQGSGVTQFSDKNGNINYLTYASIENHDWLVGTVFPKQIATQKISDFIKTAYVTWLVVGIGSSLLVTAIYVLQKKRKSEITKLAYEDPLTHHYNFNKFLEEANKNKYLTDYLLISCDIKEFKWFREIYGNEIASSLLITILDCMHKVCQSNELCCRESSDSFALLLKKESEEKIQSRLVNLAKEIRSQFLLKHQTTVYYFHFGVYIIENEDIDIRNAFQKTNYAKAKLQELSKDDIIYYQEELYQQELQAKQIEEEFENALINNQFQIYIQPKVSLINENVDSGEILVRWIHPDKGAITPIHFIPLFERNGSLERLDTYILDQALQSMKRWKELYHKELTISINASKTYLFNVGYVEKLVELINKYEINPELVEVEVTEETTLNHKEELILVLNCLKDNHIKVALDDFGSGYSSLNMLKDFPIDTVKIDQEFFKTNSYNEQKSNIIVKEVIALCHQLEMSVVAEGIETKEQIDFLKAYHCDYIQGYYYYKPMPISEFEEQFIKDQKGL